MNKNVKKKDKHDMGYFLFFFLTLYRVPAAKSNQIKTEEMIGEEGLS